MAINFSVCSSGPQFLLQSECFTDLLLRYEIFRGLKLRSEFFLRWEFFLDFLIIGYIYINDAHLNDIPLLYISELVFIC